MRSVALLVAGLLAVVFSNGRYGTGAAAWLAPTLLLLFLDRHRSWRGLAGLIPGLIGAYFVMWRGLIPAPGLLYYAIAGGYALAYSIPFIVDVSLGQLERRTWTVTLPFPCSWVTVELLIDWLGPYGSWISIAYSQTDWPVLRQGASLFGIATITFFLTWTSALAAWLVARRRSEGAAGVLPGAVAWALAALFLTTYGAVRLRRPREPMASVRAALIAPDPALRDAFQAELDPVLQAGARTSLEPLVEAARAMTDELVSATRREARAGARLIVWSETAAMVMQGDLEAFTESVQLLASEEEVHLVVGVGAWNPRATPPLLNRLIAVSPEGWVDWSYEKAHPVVGPESPFVDPGPGVLPAWDTSIGMMTAAICHDLDFPELIRQSSTLSAGVLIGPSADWPDIDWMHADMARMRSVENGVTLVRPTWGVSLVADPEGRVVASRDTFRSGTGALVATVPTVPRWTLYGVVGRGFSWLCLAGLLFLWPRARRHRSRPVPGTT